MTPNRPTPRPLARALRRSWLVLLLTSAQVPAQHEAPSPVVEVAAPASPPWLERGLHLLDIEDPVAAWWTFQQAVAEGALGYERDLGLGLSHLMLGRGANARAYGERVVATAPRRQDGMALLVRALIKTRAFDDAVKRAEAFVGRAGVPGAELLAAQASALFRVQKIAQAADVYRRVVELEREHAEAHLRLGSGLLDPVQCAVPFELRRAVAALAQGRHRAAIGLLHEVLSAEPGHPIAHRLLGEALFLERYARSMAMQDAAYRELARLLPRPDVAAVPVREFVPAYDGLSAARRAVVDRTLALFASRIDKLVAVGARHDLLLELERTTDADARSRLRGRRTFDGRVWDDVRGIGGLRAATGIESLDEAASFGFDTFAHEVAHQVHFYAFTPLQRARLLSLYRHAMDEQLCLDFYAASNEAEYFGQGVEAFVSFAKRPGGETTHGHTRFELLRRDPELYAFIASLVDSDPLAEPARSVPLLIAAVRVAIRCGRADDAIAAAGMLPPGRARDDLLQEAEAARLRLESH